MFVARISTLATGLAAGLALGTNVAGSAELTGCPLVTSVRLVWAARPPDAPITLRILGSNDGPTAGWDPLPTRTFAAPTGPAQTLRLVQPARRRCWAVEFGATDQLELAEIEFWSGARRIDGQPFAGFVGAGRPSRALLNLFDGDPLTAFSGRLPDTLRVGLDLGEAVQAKPPRFSPTPGTFEIPPRVRVTAARPDAEVRVWVSSPGRLAGESRLCDTPLQLEGSALLAAFARRPGFADSPVQLAFYRARQAPPPAAGAPLYEEPLTNSMPVRIAQWRQMEAYVQAVENATPEPHAALPSRREPNASPAVSPANPRAAFARRIGWPPPGLFAIPGPVRLQPVARDALADCYRCWIPVAPHLETYGLYLVPRSATQPAPLVIAQHGGGGFPELATFHGGSNYRDLVRGALARGWAVFAPLLLFHPYVDRDHGTPIPADVRARLDDRLRAKGTTLAAVEVGKIRGAVAALLTRPEIDARRVAMAGLSYGGFYTLYTAALEPRLRAAAVSGSFMDWGTPKTGIARPADWRPGGRLNDATPAELAALICPRPLLVQAGAFDPLMRLEPTRNMVAQARWVYDQAGRAEAFRYVEFPGRHEFVGKPVWDFFEWVFAQEPMP